MLREGRGRFRAAVRRPPLEAAQGSSWKYAAINRYFSGYSGGVKNELLGKLGRNRESVLVVTASTWHCVEIP